MYKLVYLPAALDDMVSIVKYISVHLSNPAAAERLAEEMISQAEKLTVMPYKCIIYMTNRIFRHEYRKLMIKNYIMFYYIDEDTKTITIARVLYARRNYKELLE